MLTQNFDNNWYEKSLTHGNQLAMAVETLVGSHNTAGMLKNKVAVMWESWRLLGYL